MSELSCPACDDVARALEGDDPWAVAVLETGVVRLNANQYYRGATFFVSRTCVREIHELPKPVRAVHLAEMAAVAEAVFRAFKPRKLNYEALGNSVPHLHWWLTPRHADDPRPAGPIWENLDFLRAQWTASSRPTDAARTQLRGELLAALELTDAAVTPTP